MPANAATPVIIDFEDLAVGSAVSSLDNGNVVVSTLRQPLKFNTNTVPGVAMVFDSSNPSGGDTDLGSPNESFGGPGIGGAGEMGMPFENSQAHGNVLIISEDGNGNDPDDNRNGGFITLDFGSSPRYVDSFGLLVSAFSRLYLLANRVAFSRRTRRKALRFMCLPTIAIQRLSMARVDTMRTSLFMLVSPECIGW